MAADGRHKLMVGLARLLPPLARLHDQRNALIERSMQLGGEVTKLRQARDKLARELKYYELRREQGYIIELDYPYVPRVRRWDSSLGNDRCGRIIEAGAVRYRRTLEDFLAFKDTLVAIQAEEPADERQPYWTNPWLPPLDGICLYGLLAKLNPRLYVEVGSGNSTKYVRRAISDHGLRTRIISIDPHPRAVIDQLCDEIIRKKLEDCDLSLFAGLGAEDMLFVDNSHRSFQNSDVTVVFTEILPLLGSGCTYGIHDIFLPNDYPADWMARLYNEQYLLMAYLLGGAAGDEIICPVHFIQLTPDLVDILDPIVRHPALGGALPIGGGFWMKKH
jgi:Methyltransferase domain